MGISCLNNDESEMQCNASETQIKKFDSPFPSYDIFLHFPFISIPVLCSTFRSFYLMKGQNNLAAEAMFCRHLSVSPKA